MRAAEARRSEAHLVLVGTRASIAEATRWATTFRAADIAPLDEERPRGITARFIEDDASPGRAQLAALDHAIDLVRTGRADALVTGPTSKEAIVASGTPFVGQTERCAERAGLSADDVTMLFLGERLRIAVVTRHLALRDVPGALDARSVQRSIEHLDRALVALGIASPRIAVCGLNPHAGEKGLFGDEERVVIAPAMGAARVSGRLEGPAPAEAAFRHAAEGRHDGVVAMYHDQATIPSKLLDFGRAANVTWGLPFVRTSVDHGVGLDIAGQGVADPGGMIAAIDIAIRLLPREGATS